MGDRVPNDRGPGQLEPAAAVQPAIRPEAGPTVAPETVSPHQVAAVARILGLNPDDVVSVHALQTHVDVVLYDPPAGPRDPARPLLRQVRYLVER